MEPLIPMSEFISANKAAGYTVALIAADGRCLDPDIGPDDYEGGVIGRVIGPCSRRIIQEPVGLERACLVVGKPLGFIEPEVSKVSHVRKLIIVSGAGLSAESGIDTFRDPGGMWEKFDPKELADMSTYDINKDKVVGFYNLRRQELPKHLPNAAHIVLANLERDYGNRVIHFTQNGDDLLERAGARNVVHLHGKMTEYMCRDCRHTWDIGYASTASNEECPVCKSINTKPGVIFFGEEAPLYGELDKTIKDTREDLILVIGTMGAVLPFKRLVGNRFRPRHSKAWLVNLHREVGVNYKKYFDQTYFAPVGSIIKELDERIRRFLGVV